MGCRWMVVGTVEDYQGTEAKCVFISTVRSRQRWLGFDGRYNVGLVNNLKRYCPIPTAPFALSLPMTEWHG